MLRVSKIMQNIADTISLIAGQKAIITKAKKSVAGFKMREEYAHWCKGNFAWQADV